MPATLADPSVESNGRAEPSGPDLARGASGRERALIPLPAVCCCASALAYRAWPRLGHWLRDSWRGTSRHGAARKAIRYPVAALLFGLGIYSLVRHRHPRWVRMQMGFRDLTVWSFLMASAHSTGLMLLPVLRGSRAVEAADHMAGHHHVSVAASLAALLATAVHTAAYLAVTGIIAWVVYSKFGLAILRKAWLNLNLVWAAALVVTSVLTLRM
jgi:hypothetical protein